MTDTAPQSHAHETADDLSTNTERGTGDTGAADSPAGDGARKPDHEPVEAGLPRESGSAEHGAPAAPDLVDDAAAFVDGSLTADDHTPGDGTVGARPRFGDVDAMRTAAHGREDDAAEADTSDTAPRPLETPAG